MYYLADLAVQLAVSSNRADQLSAGWPMWNQFKAFLIKQNMLALAIAVVIGAATNDVIQGLVNDFIMPIVNAVAPTKAWQDLKFPSSGPVQFTYGHFLSVLIKFIIVGFICWRLTLALIKPAQPDEKPATRECPFCLQTIDARAKRCAYCTSQLAAA
jgi:large conductance mechanosensitive channel